MRRLTATLALLLVPSLAGCGEEQQPGTRIFEATGTSSAEADGPYQAPPPFRIYAGGKEFDAWQGSYCWKRVCPWVGPPEPGALPEAGSPDSVEFRFAVPETQFSATFLAIRDGCRPRYEGTVVDLGDGRYSLAPVGPSGRYEVTVRAAAPEGEAYGTFLWTTPVDGPLGGPLAEMSLVWKPRGKIEGQGFSMRIEHLADSPRSVSATVTATASNGASMTFDAGRVREVGGCPQDGYAWFWEDKRRIADEVAALGPEPFRYDVELVLDGEAYSASATWPDDHVADAAADDPGSVPLVFDPPLPGRG